MSRPTCLNCRKPLSRMPEWRRTGLERDGKRYGAYGDGAFCTLSCGHMYACRALLAVPDLEQLVPNGPFPLGERVR